VTHREASRLRRCLDCGAPGANLLADRTGRLLRLCNECLRTGDWDCFGLRERGPICDEEPIEFAGGERCSPTADSDPVAVQGAPRAWVQMPLAGGDWPCPVHGESER
jgi:hypothetical protein